jgi:uncharacterized protein (DUF2336 family)
MILAPGAAPGTGSTAGFLKREVDMSAPAGQPASDVRPSGAGMGRRRAQLVGGHAPGAPAEPRLSLADVEALQNDCSPDARVTLAAKFGRQYDSLLDGETRSLADAVLALLVEDVEKKVRQTLAETLAASPNLPCHVARRLARDDIEVARPVLEHTPVLSDEELGEIVRTHPMPYALAVAGRAPLSEGLAEVLVATGEAEVVGRLVGNGEARISAQTLRRVAEDHRGDRSVQDRLIRRPALPSETLDLLVRAIGERLQWELLRRRRMSADEARQLMAATRARATLSIADREHGERSFERELRHRLSNGELGPDDILMFLRDGDIGRVEAGLMVLADSDLARTDQLLYGADKRGLAALCARAGFGTPHYVALRLTLDLAERGLKGDAPEDGYDAEAAQLVQEQYERIKGDDAQIRQWFRR